MKDYVDRNLSIIPNWEVSMVNIYGHLMRLYRVIRAVDYFDLSIEKLQDENSKLFESFVVRYGNNLVL